MNGPALVTGAAGFAGGHMLAELRADGVRTVGWWNPAGRPPGDRGSADWAPVDILDRSRVAEALRAVKPAAIYHCAGAAHLGASWATTTGTYERNVRGTHHVLEGARAAGLDRTRILIPGSAAIYAPSPEAIREDHPLAPTSPYALSKLAQEMLSRRAFQDLGQQILIARSFNHLGPGQEPVYAASSFARQIAEIEAGQAPPIIEVGNLDAERDLTDVRDTVRAYRLLVERGQPGTIYNVCSGRAHSMRAILDMLVRLAGVQLEVRTNPALFRPSDTPILVGDPSRLRDELGWLPAIPMERTLADLLDDWRRRVRSGANRGSAVHR